MFRYTKMFFTRYLKLSLLLTSVSLGKSGCPYQQNGATQGEVDSQRKLRHENRRLNSFNETTAPGGQVPEGGFSAVMTDLAALMIDSQEFFPADFPEPIGPNYGGLFIRLAWHCSGSYRETDGRGGCDGGRIRYDPELNWPDNANLNNALKLLEPIKEKYGDVLSWGDLIVLAGNAAITSMGGKVLGFCGGRIDDNDGSNSLRLGPSPEQEAIGPCLSLDKQGKCLTVNGTVLGPTTVGLIYVNPAGPVGEEGNTTASGQDIRTAFSRMGFNDTEAVALIGGGHAFGKMHGACETPPCGDGIGNNTFTSGFEGQWTTIPTTWSNQYFTNLFGFNWTNGTGTGGNIQWFPFTSDGSPGPAISMLTTDVAMIADPKYRKISEIFADNITLLEEHFAKAWYRLTSSDMGPAARCIGDLVPEPQEFQSPLPAPPTTLPDYVPVRSKIQEMIDSDSNNVPAFINLAYRCASTWRATDYKGGCNGARIRFSPESDWPENAGTSDALATLEEVKTAYPKVSYSDIIVLAGLTALEHNSNLTLDFCGGRVDANDASNSEQLKPRYYTPEVVMVIDDFLVKNLTLKEGAALIARENLNSSYFSDLLSTTNKSGSLTTEQIALQAENFSSIVQEFIDDYDALKEAFVSGWTKLMTSDRFLNNFDNACNGVKTATLESDGTGTTQPPAEQPSSGSTPTSPTPSSPTAEQPSALSGSFAITDGYFKLCSLAVMTIAILM